MSAWAKQQTAETISQNYDSWAANHIVSNEQVEASLKQYQAEKVRKYKIRLINEWRAKNK